jgi:hypothetical protein
MAEARRKNPEMRVVANFGEPVVSRSQFRDLTSAVGHMANFSRSLREYAKEYSFDGVHLDWQGPGEKTALLHLVKVTNQIVYLTSFSFVIAYCFTTLTIKYQRYVVNFSYSLICDGGVYQLFI